MKSYISCLATFVLLLILCSCNSSKKVTTIDFHDGSYVGEVDGKGLKHGKGTYKWLDGSFYEGDFDKDLRHGTGHFKWANGETYKGDYLQDQRTGLGIYTWPDGSFYEGSFLNGKRHGNGIFISSEGAKYEGGWFDDLRHGQGTLYDPDGRIIRGIWQNGKLLTKPMELPETTTKPDISLDTAVIYPSTDVSPSPPNGENRAVPSDFTKESLNLTPTPATESQLFESKPIETPSSEFIEKEVLTKEAPQDQVTEDTLTIPSDIKTPQEERSSSSNKLSDTDEKDVWTGTVDEVENMFVTKLIDGIDTILIRDSNKRYSGKMRILDASGEITGELQLQDGRMNGEELYYENGKLVEKNLWENGQFIKNLPVK